MWAADVPGVGHIWGIIRSSPFHQILLLCQPHQFKLAVNGSHLLEFRHRVQDLSSIDQLEIMGDLELADVKLW